MSGCSIHPNTPDKWIASMRASLASLLALPENVEAVRIRENFSGKLLGSFKQYDPNISFSKMCQESSQADPRLAYVAGLIDGEGCLRIHRQSKKTTSTYIPIVQMSMTVKANILRDQLVKEFGGKMYDQTFKESKWADQWQWRINGDEASDFVRKIYPYLMLKKPQANVILELQALKESQPMNKNGTRNWSQEAKEVAAKLKKQMHDLNKKGPDAQNVGEGFYSEPDLLGISIRFCGPYPRSGSLRNGRLYELPIVGRNTTGTGGGCLPTPTATPYGSNQGGSSGRAGKMRHSLSSMAKNNLWPTPSASDNRDRGNMSNPSIQRRQKIGKQLMLSQVVDKSSGRLSPDWVEWLMGWPIGWTDSKHWETVKSRYKRQSRGSCSEGHNCS
jgi:hypothetical protein